ncbi:MAG: UDP-N-acetylmuramate--L-alanine ligase [Anaerolineales bacterium]|nr:UDP-N-acetylmuramate--L-alanine ligase [Anaerolineales bacterium]
MSRKVHLVGIGGAGISAVAKVLHGRGVDVTGSDRARSIFADALEKEGIRIAYGHSAENVVGASLVVASSAIPEGNVELVHALELGIPVLRRDAFLRELTAESETIAVAGTHGKTTTTALIAWLLVQTGQDPTFMVGGMVTDFKSNARVGQGPHFVIEADEYDRAFLGLQPKVAVVTNVEHDHPDCYPTAADFHAAFQSFVDQVEDCLIICGDDEGATSLKSGSARKVTYGLSKEVDWRAEEIRSNPAGGSDFLVVKNGETLGLTRTRLPGEHNVKNTLAALAVVDHLGVAFKRANEALTEFHGVERRFEILGEAKGVMVVDDYAHHPTEIRATLQAARERFPKQEVWAVFQPHTYSRIRTLLDEFAQAFVDADRVLVLDVFAAREAEDPTLSGKVIAESIDHGDVRFIPELAKAAQVLFDEVREKSVVITLSAGDGNQVGRLLLEKLKASEGDE